MSKGGLSQSVQNSLSQNATALTGLAEQQQANSQSLFNLTFPGMEQAESFYQALASGDPNKIAQAISPATQQIAQATAGAKQNILQNAPSGGEKNLAIEQADVAQGAQVGQAATGSYLGAPNALAGLAGQGIGLGNQAAGTAISGLSSANSALGQLGNLQVQQKGANLGAFGSLLGAGATLGGAAISSPYTLSSIFA